MATFLVIWWMTYINPSLMQTTPVLQGLWFDIYQLRLEDFHRAYANIGRTDGISLQGM